jgi:hypothetical protein
MQDPSYFGFALKYFEFSGFSLWKHGKQFKRLRIFAITMLLSYWILNLSNISYALNDFEMQSFMKLVSLSFIHLAGIFKYLVIVSLPLMKA